MDSQSGTILPQGVTCVCNKSVSVDSSQHGHMARAVLIAFLQMVAFSDIFYISSLL